jgi:hypothetical protein
MLEIIENSENDRDSEAELKKYFGSFENTPEFILHKNVDELYKETHPLHQSAVDSIIIKLPSINQLDKESDYPMDVSEIDSDLENIFENLEDEGVDEETIIQKAVEQLTKINEGKEALYIFLLTDNFLIEDDNEFLFLLSENYISYFPSSLHAQATYISNLYLSYPENQTVNLNEIVLKLPFKITENHSYGDNNINTIHITEVLSYLFLQGFMHLTNNNMEEAEAFLKKMAVLRCKDHPYFELLRTLLTKEKVVEMAEPTPTKTHLKIVK